MVDERAQLYTIEGLTAAVIMLVTAFLVLGVTTVYSPGDVHIPDMQLEQLGNDALAMMDTPNENGEVSALRQFLEEAQLDPDRSGFRGEFEHCLEMKTGSTTLVDDIHYRVDVFYRDHDGEIDSYEFTHSGDLVGREPSIRASRWVLVDGTKLNGVDEIPSGADRRNPQMLLVEVLLWRG
jgi:hypothetical protein